MSSPNLQTAASENRIHRLALWIAAVCLVAYWLIFRTWTAPLSVALGASLAWLNLRWLSAGVEGIVIRPDPERIKFLVAKFLLRLVLIFAVLYIIIRVSSVATGGALLGLSVYVLAVMGEAVFSLSFPQENKCKKKISS